MNKHFTGKIQKKIQKKFLPTDKVFKLTQNLRSANIINSEGALPMCQTGMKYGSGQTGQRYPLGTLCSQPGPSNPASRNLPADTPPTKLGHTDTAAKNDKILKTFNAHI